MHETDIIYKKYLFYAYITSTKKLRNKVRCTNLMDSERLELLNEDAQVELYLFILGILAGR